MNEIDMEMHPLVRALAVTGRLPRAEITEALAHIEEVTSDLLAAVERAAAGKLEDQAEQNLVFFALHILGGVREQRLHAPLIRLLRRPGHEIDDLLGEVKTESLPAIIAGAFDGHAEDLFELARDPQRDEYLRGSVMAAIAFLTWDGRIDAARTRAFLERFDDDRVIEPEDNGWFSWSYIVEQLGWTDLVPRVEKAYADGRIWDGMSSIENFRKGMAETLQAAPGDASRFDQGQRYPTDVLGELEGYNFDPPAPKPAPIPREPLFSTQVHETAHNPMRHVGRNDPCPCGSGKKYKKCCLAS